MPTIEKINHLRLVNNEVSATELSNMLDVSSSIIYRHIRNLKSEVHYYVLKMEFL